MGEKRSASEMSGPPPPPRRSAKHVEIDASSTIAHVDHQLKLSLEPESAPTNTDADSTSGVPSIKTLGKEVYELGATQLRHRNKKEYEAKKLQEQGFRALPSQKCPLNRLIGMRNKNLQREQKKVNRDRESGLRVKDIKRVKREHKMGEDIGSSIRGTGPMKIRSFTAQRLDSRQRSKSLAKRMR